MAKKAKAKKASDDKPGDKVQGQAKDKTQSTASDKVENKTVDKAADKTQTNAAGNVVNQAETFTQKLRRFAAAFPWKSLAALSAVGATATAFHFAGGMPIAVELVASIGFALPANLLAVQIGTALAFGTLIVGAAVGIASGVYCAGKIAVNAVKSWMRTDAERYEIAVKAEEDAVFSLETTLAGMSNEKNEKDVAFLHELEGYLVDAPAPKFTAKGVKEKEGQPAHDRLKLLQYAHHRLEKMVKMEDPKDRERAQEKTLENTSKLVAKL